MSGHASQAQWYIARDGKQHGPVSEAELAQFIEQGHLQPTDMVWREGFADWRPAAHVFPPRAAPAARPVPPQHRPAARRPDRSGADPSYGPDLDDAEGGRRFRPARVLAILLLLAVLGGAGALAYLYRDRVSELLASVTAPSAPSGAVAVADRKSLKVPPLAGFKGGTADTIDTNLQATALWRVIKREFPDWYGERLEEAATLARADKDDAAIGQHMGSKLRELRRQHIADGLSATQQRLKAVALAFFENLVSLKKHSPGACHGLILGGGEANPAIVALLQGKEFAPGLQAQLTAMFEAIAEGRQQKRFHVRPSASDLQMLQNDLYKMGWTEADMTLFSGLAKAPPEKACQLVHDYFKAQVDVRDEEVRTKLLINALSPVFAG